MSRINRREFLALSAATGATVFAQTPAPRAIVRLHPEKPLARVPENFVGLSFEVQQIDRFSPDNKGLIDQFRALTPHGVLRLGGNSSDSAYWQPTPDSPMPPRRPAFAFGTPPIKDTPPFPIGLHNIHQLRGFLDATGWTCIYGINLATNVPSCAVEEAVAVSEILGMRLECLQIGNEADRYGINLRRDPKTWGPEAFMTEWLTFAEPIATRLPNIGLGVPDLAAKPDWFAATTDRLLHHPLHAKIVTLSYHYYIDGPASNPQMNIPNMLRSNAGVIDGAHVVHAAAASLHTTWRMTEGNTCYSGGKPDVSDVFASALWSADYFLLLASMGCAGINLHGGVGAPVAALLGAGPVPSANADSADGHPHPYYTPIASVGDRYVAEPVSYGMRFARRFAGGQMVALDFDPGTVNANAYACLLPDGRKLIAIINKDSTQPLMIDVPGFSAVLMLTGPALDARTADLRELHHVHTTSSVPPSTAMLFEAAT
jgi:hypothetical protein